MGCANEKPAATEPTGIGLPAAKQQQQQTPVEEPARPKPGYDGDYKAAGEYEGHRTYRYPNGNVYEGEWKGGKKDGRGTYRYADGRVEVGSYKADADVGNA